jgi:hypothetical protein
VIELQKLVDEGYEVTLFRKGRHYRVEVGRAGNGEEAGTASAEPLSAAVWMASPLHREGEPHVPVPSEVLAARVAVLENGPVEAAAHAVAEGLGTTEQSAMGLLHAAYNDGVRYGEASLKERARIRAMKEKLAVFLQQATEQETGDALDKAFADLDEQDRSAPSDRKRRRRLRSV